MSSGGKRLYKSLDDNISEIKQIFRDDDGLVIRSFRNRDNPIFKFCVLFIEGMTDNKLIDQYIIQPVIQYPIPGYLVGDMDVISEQMVLSHNVEKVCDFADLAERILRGESILLMDRCDKALALSTEGWKSRDITEPESEKVQRGPREGFVEDINTNLTMIRRKLPTTNLKVRNMIIGKQTRTKVSICYLDDIANKDILNELINRLEKIDFDSILDSGFIVEFIEDSPYSPFDTVGSTERPDIAVAMMLQGHIVVVVDGTPSVLTVPFLMNEYFITNDDYYINFYFSSVSRIVRVISFFITVLLPAFYVAILTYHQEMIPSPLLFSISAAREGIPFPTVVETLGLLVVFEILREVGMRVPMQIGQSLSILGAVVLGTAAVEARLVSSSVIIVIALTGLTGIMSIKIKGPAILIRFSFVLLAGFLGLYGIVWGIIVVTLHLCSLRSFGVPYMMPYTSLKPGEVANTIIRAPLRFLNKRDKFVSGENKMKMEEKDISK